MGYQHGESVAQSLSAIGGGTFWQVIATSAIMLLILVPWFAFRALGESLATKRWSGFFSNRGRQSQPRRPHR